MRVYIAFQNKGYTQERIGNILWCANKCMEGYEKYYYINLKRLEIGDIIFNIHNERIVSISVVKENAVPAKRPSILEKSPWGDDGVIVNVKYHDLRKPLDMDAEMIEQVNILMSDSDSPYTDSLSQKHGYIFEVPYTVNKLFVKKISVNNNISELQGKMLSDEDIDIIMDIDKKIKACNDELERYYILKNEFLDKIIKPRKTRLQKKCSVCLAEHMNILSAVAIKPWEDCAATEKLDINNYLLLCQNHKFLFEKGLITFNDTGIIMISDKLDYTNYKPLNINIFTSISITSKEFEYIKWHRENIFDNKPDLGLPERN